MKIGDRGGDRRGSRARGINIFNINSEGRRTKRQARTPARRPPARSPFGQRIHSLPCFPVCELTGDATSDQKELGTHSAAAAAVPTTRARPVGHRHPHARTNRTRAVSSIGKSVEWKERASERALRSPFLSLSLPPSLSFLLPAFARAGSASASASTSSIYTLPTAPIVPPSVRSFLLSSPQVVANGVPIFQVQGRIWATKGEVGTRQGEEG